MPDDDTQSDDRVQRPGGDENDKRWTLAFIRRSNSRLRRRLAELRAMITAGHTDEKIIEETGVEFQALEILKDEIYKQDRAAIDSADPVSIFIRYCLQQEGIIVELDKVIEKFSTTNQGSAIVGAIKEKSQIFDRVIKMGQDLGLIAKAGGDLRLNEESLAGRDPDEIREMIQGELDDLNELLGDATKKPLRLVDGGATE